MNNNISNNNSSNNQQLANLKSQIEAISSQQFKLREQIEQSEKNLKAQHQVDRSQALSLFSDLIFISSSSLLQKKRKKIKNKST